ncbi:MAG: methyltransferase domain-containing protein [Anaerolineaceae bacterium]
MKIINWLFKWGYHLLYHQLAWTYDFVAAIVSLGQWNTWIHLALPFLSGQHILEVGFGPGHLLDTAIKCQKSIVGIDESKQMIHRARKMISTVVDNPPLIRGNIFAMPFPDEHFDQVVSTFPSEYIFDKAAIAEIFRVLIPGGQLIILPFALIKGKLWYEKLINRILNFDSAIHIWDENFAASLKQNGFIDVSIKLIEDDRSKVMFIIAAKP